jgi:AcrR family transcriptional regulator
MPATVGSAPDAEKTSDFIQKIPLRERQKIKRRRAILDAAHALFSEFDGDDVSAEQIAHAADVSSATLYNLIGTRDQLLATLLDELLGVVEAKLARLAIDDPLNRGSMRIDICAREFIQSAPVFRYVVRKLGGLERAADVRTRHNAIIMQQAVVRDAMAAGLIDERWDACQIALQIYFMFIGALLLWAGQLLEDEHLREQLQMGYWSLLAGYASDQGRDAIIARLAEFDVRLSPDHPVLSGMG